MDSVCILLRLLVEVDVIISNLILDRLD